MSKPVFEAPKVVKIIPNPNLMEDVRCSGEVFVLIDVPLPPCASPMSFVWSVDER